jgi:hypothetical protein
MRVQQRDAHFNAAVLERHDLGHFLVLQPAGTVGPHLQDHTDTVEGQFAEARRAFLREHHNVAVADRRRGLYPRPTAGSGPGSGTRLGNPFSKTATS